MKKLSVSLLLLTACGGPIEEQNSSEEIRGHQGPELSLAIEKCIGWNYKRDDYLLNGVMRAEYHEACVNMVRASFCGDGVARTLQGTPIDLADTALMNAPATSPADGYYFEAAWGQKGAFCLSKKRWATLPLGGYCPDRLPDPRVPGSNAKYCEEIARADLDSLDPAVYGAAFSRLHAHGARMLSKSAFLDAGLYRWTSPYTGAPLTTTDGFYGGPWSYETVSPAISGFEGAWEARYEGTAFTAIAPSLLGLPAGSYVELNLWRSPRDYVTAVYSPGADYVRVRSEGFIYSKNAPLASLPFGDRARKLYVYTTYAGTTVTSTERPAFSVPHLRTEGWILYLR